MSLPYNSRRPKKIPPLLSLTFLNIDSYSSFVSLKIITVKTCIKSVLDLAGDTLAEMGRSKHRMFFFVFPSKVVSYTHIFCDGF